MMCSRVGSVLDAILGPVMDEYVRNARVVDLLKDVSRSYSKRHDDISLLEVLGDGLGSSKALRFEGPNCILNSILGGPADDNEGHTAFVPTLRAFLNVSQHSTGKTGDV
jgi:hypothetical protein